MVVSPTSGRTSTCAHRPDLRFELALWRAGTGRVAGIDEVGRGPLAGPVLAAAVVLPPFFDAPWLSAVRDSKLLPPSRREELAGLIHRDALAVGVGAASAADIDRAGLTAATRAAATAALAGLGPPPEFLLLDAMLLPEQAVDQAGVIDGDAQVLSIACASIVAKVARDALMTRMDGVFPGYNFARHKGYGTAEHLCALDRLGPCPAHRRSFAPVRTRMNEHGR
jgi:ribonuclease HII